MFECHVLVKSQVDITYYLEFLIIVVIVTSSLSKRYLQ